MGKRATVEQIFLVNPSAPVDGRIYQLTVNVDGKLTIDAISDDLATALAVLVSERNGITAIEGWELFTQLSVNSDQPDTVAAFSVEATGTNGAKSRTFVGTRNPEGNISANPGDFYVRVGATPAQSRCFQLRAVSGSAGWVDVGAVPLAWSPSTFSGAGPHALISNAVNLYNDSAADAFIMNMPASPQDGDEVWLCEIGGSRNPVTLAGNGNNVTEWATLNVAAASVVLASEGLVVGYKFLSAVGVWKRIVDIQDQDWTPRNFVGVAITLGTNDVVKYDGAATFTISLPATPIKGTIVGVSENQGSGVGVVTVAGNGNNLVNDAAASAASMALSSAYAYRQWRWDSQSAIWLMTHTVN